MDKHAPERSEVSSGAVLSERPVVPHLESRRDDLLGKTVIFMVIAVVIASVGFLAYLGYHATGSGSPEGVSIVSIASVPDTGKTSESDADVQETKTVSEAEKTVEGTLQKASIPVVVLNGGAPKGSAAVISDMLKADGFTQVSTGNSSEDYSGLVIYRTDGNETSAEAVKIVLSKKYPSVTVRAADPKRSETSRASVTVVFGK